MKHRSPPPPARIDWAGVVGLANVAVAVAAVFAIVVTTGQAVAPVARADTPPSVPEPTVPRAYGPLRPIFTPLAATPDVAGSPAIATSAPRNVETGPSGVPGTPRATTRAPSASQPTVTSQPSATTTTTAAATTTASPTTTPAPTTTTSPTPTETTPTEEPTLPTPTAEVTVTAEPTT